MNDYDLKILGVKFIILMVTVIYGVMIMILKSRVSEINNKCNIQIEEKENEK